MKAPRPLLEPEPVLEGRDSPRPFKDRENSRLTLWWNPLPYGCGFQFSTTFAALSDPTRRGMIERLSHGPASVHGLTESFAISQQMISKHVAYLVRARIVVKKKRGPRECLHGLGRRRSRRSATGRLIYRRFWEESFDKLDVVVNEMKKMEFKRWQKTRLAIKSRMVITRVFDAPRRIGLEGVDRPHVCNAMVGPEGFYGACLQDGFSRGRKISCFIKNSGWPGFLECR